MAKSVQARASDGRAELTVQAHDTDSPLLPVAQLEQLQKFRPDLVDFVVSQTKAEAEHRREQNARINTFVFAERLIGQLSALTLGIVGIFGGLYAGLNGQPTLGGVIATATIGTLAVAFLKGRQTEDKK
jgi:uncharacterized membrane protein